MSFGEIDKLNQKLEDFKQLVSTAIVQLDERLSSLEGFEPLPKDVLEFSGSQQVTMKADLI